MNKNILTNHQISSKVIEIIENAEQYCFLVTPYFKPWPILQRALLKAAQKEKTVVFIVRSDVEQNKNLRKFNDDFGFDLVFVDRLHTKLYLNEKEVLVSSMNLYDASKELNYELGYLVANRVEAKNFKEQIIDDDLLGAGQFEVVKGRYFQELERKEEEALAKAREKEQVRKSADEKRKFHVARKLSGETFGFCVRCAGPIPEDGNYPMCMKCFQIWSQYENVDYVEKYCHRCGNEKSAISIGRPICMECRSAS